MGEVKEEMVVVMVGKKWRKDEVVKNVVQIIKRKDMRVRNRV